MSKIRQNLIGVNLSYILSLKKGINPTVMREFLKVMAAIIIICPNVANADNLKMDSGVVESATISSLLQINDYIPAKAKKSPNQLCLIYDMDNTILSAEPKLGGDSWMSWNNGLDKNNPNKITNWGISNDIHGFEGSLRFFIRYYPTESNTLAVVNDLKDKQHYPSIVMTARSYERYYAATNNQLKINGFDFTSNPIGQTSSFSSPLVLIPNKEHTAYKAYFNGVYYSADDNKGDEIMALIKQQRKITKSTDLCRNVIFVDNSASNTVNVYNALKNNHDNINLTALRYSAYDGYMKPAKTSIESWQINNKSTAKALLELINQLN